MKSALVCALHTSCMKVVLTVNLVNVISTHLLKIKFLIFITVRNIQIVSHAVRIRAKASTYGRQGVSALR